MACCKCCCGGVDCTEGQQGKCCCGGSYGSCCQEGEYCCGGVCEPSPCGCEGDCFWIPVWLNDGTWAGGWELDSGGCDEGCLCAEPDVQDVGTQSNPASPYAYQTPCEPIAATMQAQSGPGTELKALLQRIGITPKPGCACNKRAAEMDANGCDWCAANIDTIDGWLAEEAKKRKLPYLSVAGKALILLAIRRARKRGNNP